jgi:hypothetical protein
MITFILSELRAKPGAAHAAKAKGADAPARRLRDKKA